MERSDSAQTTSSLYPRTQHTLSFEPSGFGFRPPTSSTLQKLSFVIRLILNTLNVDQSFVSVLFTVTLLPDPYRIPKQSASLETMELCRKASTRCLRQPHAASNVRPVQPFAAACSRGENTLEQSGITAWGSGLRAPDCALLHNNAHSWHIALCLVMATASLLRSSPALLMTL